MRIRRFLSSAAVLTVFLAGSALTSGALAQKGEIMSPSTGWSVTKIDDRGGVYCAMARQFNQNTVLTMARNGASETSFALDFQGPVFASQQDIEVILDPGAGQQRRYQTQAVSNKAFVVRMGQDERFFGALERTGLLRVEAGGKSYSFDVVDIDVGQEELSACVANSVLPAAGEELLSLGGSVGASVDTGQQFRQEINTLRRQIKALQTENEVLKTASEAQGGGQYAAEPLKQLSGTVRELENDNAKLKSELNLARSAKIEAVSRVDIAALDDLRADNARLQEELSAFTAQGDVVSRLEDEISSLKSRNDNLRASVTTQNGHEGLLTQLNAKIAALGVENNSLKATLDNRGVDAELLEQLRQQIAHVENENRLLQETAAQAQGELEERLRRENTARIAELEQELTVENSRKAQELVEVGEVASELAALQEANTALREKSSLADAERAQAASLLVRIEGLETDKRELQTQLDGVQSSGVDAAQELLGLSAENEALKAALHEQEAQAERIAELVQQRSDLKAALRDVVLLVDGFKKENVSQKQLIAALEDKNRTLNEEIDVAVNEVKDEVSETEAEPVPAQSVIFTAPVAPRTPQKARVAPEPEDALETAAAPAKEEEVAVASPAPVPPKKPQHVAAAQELPETELGEVGSRDDEGVADDVALYDALLQIEKDIRTTPPEDAGRLQYLVREHETLKAIIDQKKADEFGAKDVQITEISESAVVQQEFAAAEVYEDLSGLNQAQIYERSLKRQREEKIVKVAAPEITIDEVLPAVVREKNVVLRQAEDPFAGIVVENEVGERIESVLQDTVVKSVEVAPEAENMLQRFAGEVQESAQPVSSDVLVVRSSIAELIARADVVSSDRVKRIEKKSDAFTAAYQWGGDGVYGSAEQKPMSSPDEFDVLVMDYLQRTQSRCPGEFAVVPDNTVGEGTLRADSYEVACVSENVSSGASLLFFNQGGEFTVVAHEAPAEDLGAAIDYRNQVMRVVTGS